MKGERLIRILEFIEEAAVDTLNLFEVFLSSGYGASFNKIEYELEKRKGEKEVRAVEKAKERKMEQRYYTMLYKLKRDGLIREKTIRDKKHYIITRFGKSKLQILKKHYSGRLKLPEYRVIKSKIFTIIVFDIPEKERKKRNWLRGALRNLGFRMIQKSVWIGKVKVPQEFLDDLYELRIAEYVEIFEISKGGTLEHII